MNYLDHYKILMLVIALSCLAGFARASLDPLPPHVHTTDTRRPLTFAAQTPEYVEERLLSEVDALRDGFAKKDRVPMGCRQSLLAKLSGPGAVAALVGGQQEERDGSDTDVLFRQESNFLYLSGFDHPGAKLLVGLDSSRDPGLDLQPGAAWLFVPHGNAVWDGRDETLEDFEARYDVDGVFWLEDFDKQLEALAPRTVFTLANAPIQVPEATEHDTVALRGKLAEARAVKTPGEIALSRAAASITVAEHETVMRKIRCRERESDAESLFRYVGHNYGARFQAYIPIVGAGRNAAALHYTDNDAVIPDGSLVLIDAGAELGGSRNGGGWTSDVTRTWPCSGTFTAKQRLVYDAVFAAQDACVQLCVPGSSMAAATAASDRKLIEGLLAAGILRDGTVDELVAARMQRIFMPHGLGHSVGLDVHDPGSISPFAPGMVLTCEPGIYFYPTLVEEALRDPARAKYLDAEVTNTFMGMGGVRIEDTVLVTDGAPENLSGALARTADEVEALMARGAPAAAV